MSVKDKLIETESQTVIIVKKKTWSVVLHEAEFEDMFQLTERSVNRWDLIHVPPVFYDGRPVHLDLLTFKAYDDTNNVIYMIKTGTMGENYLHNLTSIVHDYLTGAGIKIKKNFSLVYDPDQIACNQLTATWYEETMVNESVDSTPAVSYNNIYD